MAASPILGVGASSAARPLGQLGGSLNEVGPDGAGADECAADGQVTLSESGSGLGAHGPGSAHDRCVGVTGDDGSTRRSEFERQLTRHRPLVVGPAVVVDQSADVVDQHGERAQARRPRDGADESMHRHGGHTSAVEVFVGIDVEPAEGVFSWCRIALQREGRDGVCIPLGGTPRSATRAPRRDRVG